MGVCHSSSSVRVGPAPHTPVVPEAAASPTNEGAASASSHGVLSESESERSGGVKKIKVNPFKAPKVIKRSPSESDLRKKHTAADSATARTQANDSATPSDQVATLSSAHGPAATGSIRHSRSKSKDKFLNSSPEPGSGTASRSSLKERLNSLRQSKKDRQKSSERLEVPNSKSFSSISPTETKNKSDEEDPSQRSPSPNGASCPLPTSASSSDNPLSPPPASEFDGQYPEAQKSPLSAPILSSYSSAPPVGMYRPSSAEAEPNPIPPTNTIAVVHDPHGHHHSPLQSRMRSRRPSHHRPIYINTSRSGSPAPELLNNSDPDVGVVLAASKRLPRDEQRQVIGHFKQRRKSEVKAVDGSGWMDASQVSEPQSPNMDFEAPETPPKPLSRRHSLDASAKDRKGGDVQRPSQSQPQSPLRDPESEKEKSQKSRSSSYSASHSPASGSLRALKSQHARKYSSGEVRSAPPPIRINPKAGLDNDAFEAHLEAVFQYYANGSDHLDRQALRHIAADSIDQFREDYETLLVQHNPTWTPVQIKLRTDSDMDSMLPGATREERIDRVFRDLAAQLDPTNSGIASKAAFLKHSRTSLRKGQ